MGSTTPISDSDVPSGQLVAGVDGCRGGWVVVFVDQDGGGRPADVAMVPDLIDLIGRIDAGVVAAAAIDIPIGLAARDARSSDIEARKRLGARRSSVFPAPVRAVLGASTYVEACAISRATCGKAISRQLFNILPKIREVDDLLTTVRQRRLVEMCPELSLALLAGAPMTHAKTTPAGRAERMRVLGSAFGTEDIEHHARQPPPGARVDDVLDAFAGAWTARRYAAAAHLQLGGQLDDRGLRMEVVA
jgi:predicted RNase H-like nuclease